MRKAYIFLLLMTLCLPLAQAQDSLVGKWITHYYKADKKEIKCQDKFDVDRLELHVNGTYSKQYFIPMAPDDTEIQATYDLASGTKKYFTSEGNEVKFVRVKKVQEYGRYKIVDTSGHIQFTNDKKVYVKRVLCKGRSLMIMDSLDSKLFIRVYKRA